MAKSKRLLSLLMALAMVISLLPNMVWATDDVTETETETETTTLTYAEQQIKSAYEAIPADGWTLWGDDAAEVNTAPTVTSGNSAARNTYNIKLTKDTTWSSTVIIPNYVNFNLDLNGYTLTTGTSYMFNLSKGAVEVSIFDSSATGEGTIVAKSASGGGVAVMTGGSNVAPVVLNFYGGNIDCSAVAGNNGGVARSAAQYNFMNVYGGNLKGANVGGKEGGVFYCSGGGTISIYGGSIWGGTAKNGGNIYTKGVLIISGNAKIYNGVATTNGGNICALEAKSVEISGSAEIYGGAANADRGGNVFVGDNIPLSIIENARIYNGTASKAKTNNVYVGTADKLTINFSAGGHIYQDNKSGSGIGLVNNVFTYVHVACECGSKSATHQPGCSGARHTDWYPWDKTVMPSSNYFGDKTKTETRYYLTTNISVAEVRKVNADQTVYLDLNGYTVTKTAANDRLWTVDNANSKAVLSDSVGTGRIELGESTYDGGFVASLAEFVMYGGTVNGANASVDKGGVIRVAEGGTVKIYGGEIIGGHAAVLGGAINSSGNLLIAGGKISGGSAGTETSGTGGNISADIGKVEITGGEISGGVASKGGNIYINGCELSVTGGNIKDGTAYIEGGNVLATYTSVVNYETAVNYVSGDFRYVRNAGWYANGSLVVTHFYNYGDQIVAPETNPVKAPDATNHYKFIGWAESEDGEVVASFPTATESAVFYYAVFSASEHSFSDWVDSERSCDCGYTETCAEHVDEGNDHVCDICGTSVGTHANNAQHPCVAGKCEYCGEVFQATANHAYDNNCDATCNVCGGEREVGEHKIVYDQGDRTHTPYCDVCGTEMATEDCVDANGDAKCDKCDQILAAPVVTLNGNNYYDLDEALADAKAGDVLVLLQSATIASATTLKAGITYVIPTGKTLIVAENVTVTAEAGAILDCAGVIEVDGTADISALSYPNTFKPSNGKLNIGATGKVIMLTEWAALGWTPVLDATKFGDMLGTCADGASVRIGFNNWSVVEGTWTHDHTDKWGDWITDTESSCEEPGSKHRTCSGCGLVETEEIPVKDHIYSNGYCGRCEAEQPGAVFVAMVEGFKFKFTTLEAALGNANYNKKTIKLLADQAMDLIVLADGAALDLNGFTFTGDILGTVSINGGKWITPEEQYQAGPDSDNYKTTDGVFNMSTDDGVNINVTIVSGRVESARAEGWTLENQVLIIGEDATFVIPKDNKMFVRTPVIVNGALEILGEVILYNAQATITTSADLTVTTSVADSKVAYKNGVYMVVAKEYTAEVGGNKYESVQDAADEAIKTGEVLVLTDKVDSITVDVGEILVLDFNGNNVETLVVNGTLVGIDEATKNYGAPSVKVKVEGTGTVKSVHKVDTDTADHTYAGYAAHVDSEGYTTFNYFQIKIATVVLRPEKGGLGYKMVIGGNANVIDLLTDDDAFGITVTKLNGEGNGASASIPATSFITGSNTKVVVIENILKEGKLTENAENIDAALCIAAYLNLGNEQITVSYAAGRSLRQVIESVNSALTTNPSAYNDVQKAALKAMYDKYDLGNAAYSGLVVDKIAALPASSDEE